MSRITVLENDFATVWYYPDEKIVHHQYHKFIYGQAFRDVLTKGADIFEEYGATKWLSDDRNNSALPNADAEWSFEHWTPRVIDAGWKHWAVVLPKKVIGQMNMQRWIKMYSEKGVTVQVFTDPDEAMAWLKSQ